VPTNEITGSFDVIEEDDAQMFPSIERQPELELVRHGSSQAGFGYMFLAVCFCLVCVFSISIGE